MMIKYQLSIRLSANLCSWNPQECIAMANYYAFPINIDGMEYATVEHYFQAEKFRGALATERSLEYAYLIAQQSV